MVVCFSMCGSLLLSFHTCKCKCPVCFLCSTQAFMAEYHKRIDKNIAHLRALFKVSKVKCAGVCACVPIF